MATTVTRLISATVPVVATRRGDRRAVHGVVVADDGAHAVDRLDLVPLGHGDREERRGVLVVGLDGVGVLHLEGLADVDGVVEPT